jgi:hypothetical protein
MGFHDPGYAGQTVPTTQASAVRPDVIPDSHHDHHSRSGRTQQDEYEGEPLLQSTSNAHLGRDIVSYAKFAAIATTGAS